MRFLAFLTILFSFSTAQATKPVQENTVTVGSPAPLFSAQDTHGNDVTLESLKGKHVVLEWKNHQCPFVRKHYSTDNMQSLQQYAKDNDIIWISIISSAKGKQGHVSAEEANKIAEEETSHAAHIILDAEGTIGRLYNAKTTPHMYIINKDGDLAYMGAIDDISTADPDDVEKANNYVKAAMEALVEGKTPEIATTSAYGCSVKYDY